MFCNASHQWQFGTLFLNKALLIFMPSLNDEKKFELFYTEASQSYRHYSISIREIRIISIAQGIIVLTGSGYLLQNKLYNGALAVAVFGILLTFSLWRLHKTYYRNLINYLEYLSEHLEMDSGPWSNHRQFHKERVRKQFAHAILKDSIFILLLVSNMTLSLGIICKIDL